MIIEKNKENTLPYINFNEKSGTIFIEGRSIENSPERFYESFINYLKEFLLKHPMNLEITIDIDYFNTRSAGPLLHFFKLCQTIIDKGFKLKVNWLIDSDDDNMLDAAEDYSSILKLPFNIIIHPGN